MFISLIISYNFKFAQVPFFSTNKIFNKAKFLLETKIIV